MPAITSLDVLLEATRNARDSQARRLAEELDTARAAEDRLQLLERYRHDYEMGLRQRGVAGLDANAYRDYRLFLAQLDAAIEAQRSTLAARREKAEGQRAAYDRATLQVRRYERVAERREIEARTTAERGVQRADDERSTLAFRNRVQ